MSGKGRHQGPPPAQQRGPAPSAAAISEMIGLFNGGQWSQLEAKARDAVKRYPGHLFGWKILGAMLLQTGRLLEAIDPLSRTTKLFPRDAESHNNLGVALMELGRLDEAEACYRRAIAIRPDAPGTHNNLGNALKGLGRLDEAEACYGRAIALQPDYADAHSNLGNTLKYLGRLDEAEASYRRAIAIRPDYAEVHSNLGVVLSDLARPDEAEASYRRAVAIKPDYAEAQYNLGNVLIGLRRLDEAEACYRRAIAIKPDYAGALNNLGGVLKDLGRLDEAEACYRRAIALQPDYADANNNFGNTLSALGRLDEAEACYRRAIAIKPDYAEAHYNLGAALRDLGRLDEAELSYRHAIVIKPDFSAALNNLGLSLRERGHPGQAIDYLTRCLAITPDHSDALLNLGNAFKDLGLLEDAVARYDEALRLNPRVIGALHNRLFTLTGMDSVSAETVAAEHRRAGAALMALAPNSPALPFANPRDPGRRLRVGYVSPDFRRHSVSYFLEPLLAAHDRAGFEIFCYAEVIQPDEVTARLQRHADHWLITAGMPDDALAARIRADGIDILIDLAGHTAGNRLPLFARRPAPIQATWLGYPNTTGLPAIDYRLADAISDPPGWGDALASETLLRLPGGFLCFGPPVHAPPPGVPPCLAAGAVTFGSFNNPAKISLPTIESWSAILKRLPDARLLLKSRQLVDAMTWVLLRTRFAERGIPANRVDMLGFQADTVSHLEVYHRVDIALDPFPYNGATTTCEALWMGVPVVTLAGDRHAARVGASLLSRVGLDGLIAASRDEYVERAVDLAGDRERLAALRSTLRPDMAASSLCDATAFARGVEAAYRGIWERWQARK